jgi:hypothetical protein
MKFKILILLAMGFPALAVSGEYIPMDKIPADVKPFIEQGTLPLALEAADLNGDGLKDRVLVLEKQKKTALEAEMEENQRPLLILIRESKGSLKLAKRNDKIVYCSSCGGVLGDPFQGIKASSKSFEVYLNGGSRERWSFEYRFNYSRKDNTWQLARVRETYYDTLKPNAETTEVYTPPKDYGKIDIADFDPDHWKGQGKR